MGNASRKGDLGHLPEKPRLNGGSCATAFNMDNIGNKKVWVDKANWVLTQGRFLLYLLAVRPFSQALRNHTASGDGERMKRGKWKKWGGQ